MKFQNHLVVIVASVIWCGEASAALESIPLLGVCSNALAQDYSVASATELEWFEYATYATNNCSGSMSGTSIAGGAAGAFALTGGTFNYCSATGPGRGLMTEVCTLEGMP